MTEINYEVWATDMCTLLDAIEIAVNDGDLERVKTLVMGRFDLAEKNGLTFTIGGQAPPIQ
ncbi:hypothetical protein LCGC14_1963910 [marine sediment metagenome]|uniref:Uncharacterized protein n=1 Tax=marine sediment metagenome TaxID=412755 RepID=A0A0F9HS61_9ZZZZ